MPNDITPFMIADERNRIRHSVMRKVVDPRGRHRAGSFTRQIVNVFVDASERDLKLEDYRFYPKMPLSQNEDNFIRNACVSNMRELLNTDQGIGESLAEGREAVAYVAGRVQSGISTIINIRRNPVRYVRKVLKSGRGGAARELRRRMRKSRKKVNEFAKEVPANWLEWNFAILPLTGIHDQLKNAFTLPKVKTLRTRARGNWTQLDSKSRQHTDYTMGSTSYRLDYNLTYVMTCDVEIQNPNLALAARFGVTNPISIGWAVVPFSWALDYFTNIGEVLKNFEPAHPGLKVSNSSTSRILRYKSSFNLFHSTRATTSSEWSSPRVIKAERHGLDFVRNPGMSLSYKLIVNPQAFSVKRVSLLLSVMVQLLKGK